MERWTRSPVSSETEPWLPPSSSSVSSSIPYSGIWPSATASYYIIIVVTAADDANPANEPDDQPRDRGRGVRVAGV